MSVIGEPHDNLRPVSEDVLHQHYVKCGAMYPGERVCSRARWRMHLAKEADPQRYRYAASAIMAAPNWRWK